MAVAIECFTFRATCWQVLHGWHRSSFWHSSHLLMQHLCIKWGSDRDSVILFLMQCLFLHCFMHVTCLQAYFFGAWASGKCQVITRHSVAYPNKACKATGDISHQKQHSRKRNHQSRRHGSVGPLECDGKKKLHASGINYATVSPHLWQHF